MVIFAIVPTNFTPLFSFLIFIFKTILALVDCCFSHFSIVVPVVGMLVVAFLAINVCLLGVQRVVLVLYGFCAV